MSKPRVGLLGANGQVATEVALFATLNDDFEVIGFVRSEYSAVMLKLLGVEYSVLDHGRIDPHNERLLASCDLVVDFSYPGVQTQEILPAIRRNTDAVLRCLRRGAQYLYMSSIAAFGMPPESSEFRKYAIPRNTYAFIKRKAEKFVTECAAEREILPYVFRLGQVHGVLQSVSKYFADRISLGTVMTTGEPNSLCNIIFPHSIYYAIVRCARHELVPKTAYSLVAWPQWPLHTLFAYYQHPHRPGCKIVYIGSTSGKPQSVWKRFSAALFPSRGVMEPVIMTIFPSLLPRIKAWYRRKAVRYFRQPVTAVDILNITGAIAPPVVDGICSSVEETVIAQRRIEEKLLELLEGSAKSGRPRIPMP